MKKEEGRRTVLHRGLTGVVAVTAAIALLAGCGKKDSQDVATTSLDAGQEQQATGTDTTQAQSWDGGVGEVPEGALTVVASPGVHTDILRMAQSILADEGIELYIDSDFDDYLMPNLLVDGGVYECNYFQHEEYLATFNAEQGTDLVSVGKIHFEPLGIYRGVKWSLDDLTDGDVITIPRDTANQARALKLLSDVGLISLDTSVQDPSINDVTDNPKGLRLELMDASQVPSAVANSAFVVMNGNYARQALYTVTSDAIAYENPKSSVAGRYANIIAVNRENANDPRVLALVKALQSEDVRNYMETKYAGAVVPYTGS
ncbi:MAG: metal ABC transporter substrate-binding protein [Lachnospiraceae bacterium]|nr:metal ABC transporter substrate-binding protein [Lachnospiraceae bacterium]